MKPGDIVFSTEHNCNVTVNEILENSVIICDWFVNGTHHRSKLSSDNIMEYDVPVFAPSSEAELKATVTYKDFIENGTRFVIKEYRGAYSIFRPREDIRSIK